MKKILIIRFSSIGDIVLTTPVVRCLKKQLGAEVHYLTKKKYKDILISNPSINKVYTIEKRIREVIGLLKAEKYDYVIDLHHNLRSARLKWALLAKSFSFNKLNGRKWLLTNFKINLLPDLHVIDRYFKTVANLGVVNDKLGMDYFIPPEEEVDFLERPFIVFVIGATYATKRLPGEKVLAICRELNVPVILLGGLDVALLGGRIADELGPDVINGCGQFSLNQSASIVKQSSAVITFDTGLMHIAAAFQKPIVSIWGNTVPAFGMYPYFKEGKEISSIVEVKGLSCRPCSKLGHSGCPRKHFRCMQDISIHEVITKIKALF